MGREAVGEEKKMDQRNKSGGNVWIKRRKERRMGKKEKGIAGKEEGRKKRKKKSRNETETKKDVDQEDKRE